MIKPTIAVIGSGNMGSSLIGGLIADGYPTDCIIIADPDQQKLKHIEHQFGVKSTTHNRDAIQAADIVILAVKPQIMTSVLDGIHEVVRSRKPLLISVAAGIRIETLQEHLGSKTAIVRCMPNTPALIGCGASALFANPHVSAPQHEQAEAILRAVGLVVWLEDEAAMDAVTALSGSGPAYFFLVMEILQQVGESLGLPKKIAELLTLQTGFGATRMALESTVSVQDLRRHVTSPGGTTEAALNVLETENIAAIFTKALQAAAARSKLLADQFGKKEIS